ncbi:hypothetical protein ACO22_06805 [Paracoccidioides brasiliensis]|uniref:YAG7-like dimerisation domain-containing protein n=1 Tax=Paracoccidioides brasiliensis TaxID=121759 RepID=A0A1D2J6I2_PARBR|nr:hypothetical protein ACO22_06805 [Paracoccidioides brasiliensis]ODH52895.1 hypothetical protein GX48_00762 [Paracoccidioides brasiliensis]
MSAPVSNNPPQSESKSAKKKRSKGESSSSASAAVADTSNPGTAAAETATNVVTGGTHEPAFLKELYKSLRNAVKKLNATSKVDAIVAENPSKSLDDLVADKKINADQKAQILKKPGLQAAVSQIEEQINQYKIYGQYYEDRLINQKADLEKAHKGDLDALKAKVVAETLASAEKEFRERLLVLSRFLRAAAAMRRSGDETSNDSRAFEGALFQVYGGTEEAVNAMLKLIDGAEDTVPSVDAEPLDVPYSRVKQASLDYVPPAVDAWTEEAQATESASSAEANVSSDPTLVNAGLTELHNPSLSAPQRPTTNGFPASGNPQHQEISSVPMQSIVGNDSANAVTQMRWDNQGSNLSASTAADGWIEVKKADVEGTTTQNALPPTSGSWAEDIPAVASIDGTSPEPNDGFKPVVSHNTRQNSGRGRGFRGRGPRGEGFRGRGGFRGDRGEYRGRGRGRGGEYRGRGRGGYGNNGQIQPAPHAAEHMA